MTIIRYNGRRVKIMPPDEAARSRVIARARQQNLEREARWARQNVFSAPSAA